MEFSPAPPSEAPEVCGSDAVTFFAGQHIAIGEVTISNSEDTLTIAVSLVDPWLMSLSHLHVADDVAGIPQTRSGNPRPGHFEYHTEHDPPVSDFTYEIPLADLPIDGCGEDLVIALHAEVNGDSEETAWADGDRFRARGNWATYVTYEFACCDDEPPGDECPPDSVCIEDSGFEVSVEACQDGDEVVFTYTVCPGDGESCGAPPHDLSNFRVNAPSGDCVDDGALEASLPEGCDLVDNDGFTGGNFCDEPVSGQVVKCDVGGGHYEADEDGCHVFELRFPEGVGAGSVGAGTKAGNACGSGGLLGPSCEACVDALPACEPPRDPPGGGIITD